MLFSCALLLFPPSSLPETGIYFSDASDRLILGNDSCELTLSKMNGAILTLLDKMARAPLPLSSRGGCLWGSSFRTDGPLYRGGCGFSASDPNRFSYRWDATNAVLTLSYQGNSAAAQYVNATVTVTASAETFFDLRLKLENHMAAEAFAIYFPSDLSCPFGKRA